MTPKEELETARLAFQFMTRLPIRDGAVFDKARMAQSIRYYPGVGMAVGACAAIAYAAGSCIAPLFAPVLAIAVAMIVTGALHEDGLADLVDGFWGGHSIERRLEIMRDSAIGSYGTLALIVVVLAQYSILQSMLAWQAMFALILGHGFSRAAVVVVMQKGRYMRATGAGENLTTALSYEGRMIFIAQTALLFALAIYGFGVWNSIAAFSFMALIPLSLYKLARLKIGGYTGDVLGATQQLSYIGCLAGLSL